MSRLVKIISDGTQYGTDLVDADGNRIEGVVDIQINKINRNSFPLTAVVTLLLDSIELDGVEVVEAEPQ